MQATLARIASVLIALIAVGALPAAAQTTDEVPLIAGRMALAEGDAQIWRVDESQAGAWDLAQINDVITVSTGLHTGADGKMELRIGPHALRLADGSRGGFSQLDYGSKVFNLEHGTLSVRLLAPEPGDALAVTAAGLRIELFAPGRYRIEADARSARVTAFEGQAVVRGGTGSVTVSAGRALSASDNLASASFEQLQTTAFDQWALARDDRYREVTATRYVSPYMTGHEELDLHGDWIADANYGTLWAPRAVPVGWAPYRHGQWRWVSPWGWTWVDHAPWGYAPFHYGRWVTVGNRWCWWPGGYVRRPAWAPALVGFVGGSGVNVAISVGGPVVGWYPLAPWHRYQPSFRGGPRYVTVINQTIINAPPRGVHRDINRERGGTMVPGPRFRDPVTRVALTDRSKFAQLQPISTPPPTAGRGDDRRDWRGQDQRPARGEDRGGWRGDDGRGNRGEDRRGDRGDDRRPDRGDDRRWTRGEDGGAQRRPSGPTRTAPVGEASRPTRIAPPLTADSPAGGLTPAPALPGNAPQLTPTPPMRVAPPVQQARPVRPAPEVVQRPVPHLPADQLPPGPRPRFTDPAEPARTPPGVPPTVRQPTRGPSDRVAPPMRAQPAPPMRAQPSAPPVAVSAPVAPAAPVAPPAPRTAAPRPERVESPRFEGRRAVTEGAVREAREGGRAGARGGPGRSQLN